MNDRQQRFAELHPGAFFLTADQPEALQDFLKRQSWIAGDEIVERIEKPGEGNMNYVLRVVTNRRSLIVKQARPWVEKYPQIAAPIERIRVEALFYAALWEIPALRRCTPALIDFQSRDFIIAVEDLGEASDFTDIYKKSETITAKELTDLITFLTGLHQLDMQKFRNSFPENLALRQLNAEHIFTYPYLEENGLDLDTVQKGLQQISLPYKRHTELKKAVASLGEIYLSPGNVLIHGDYYPGSWLRTTAGPRVIDPEFAFVGYAEFDLGVLVAHLKMAQVDEALIQNSLAGYKLGPEFDRALFAGFCGAEILRRIIGLAQLPLDLSLEEKAGLLDMAVRLVVNPTENTTLFPE